MIYLLNNKQLPFFKAKIFKCHVSISVSKLNISSSVEFLNCQLLEESNPSNFSQISPGLPLVTVPTALGSNK